MRRHLSGSPAESEHPELSEEGRGEAAWSHVAGQQPGRQGDRRRSTQVQIECSSWRQHESFFFFPCTLKGPSEAKLAS